MRQLLVSRGPGLRVELGVDCPRLADHLQRFLFDWLAVVSFLGGGCLRASIRGHWDGRRFRLTGDGLDEQEGSWESVYRALQWAIDRALLAECQAHAVIHAGAVACDGVAILLPGASGSGKTSLVRAFLAAGAHYLSDEYAILDGQGLVHPYPRPLMLRDSDGVQRPVLTSELGAPTASEPCPARAILVLTYREGARLQLQPAPFSQGLLVLLQNSPQVLVEAPSLMAASRAAMKQVTNVLEGIRGESGPAVVEILEFLRLPRGRHTGE